MLNMHFYVVFAENNIYSTSYNCYVNIITVFLNNMTSDHTFAIQKMFLSNVTYTSLHRGYKLYALVFPADLMHVFGTVISSMLCLLL